MPLAATINLPTILIAAVIAAIFAAIVIRGIRRRKRGESGCSCGCSGCPNSTLCHVQREESDRVRKNERK